MSPEDASVTGGRRNDHVGNRVRDSSPVMIRYASNRYHIGCTATEIYI